jgi:NitT/TauT family transport system substrate-binding protein
MREQGDTPLGSTSRRSRMWLALLAVVSLLMVTLTGCGLLGGDTDEPQASNGQVEKAKIRVGLLPVVDVATLYMAVQKGNFQQEGLEVEPVVLKSSTEALAALIGGDIDVSFSTYPAAIAAQTKGAADLKFVADAYQAAPGHHVVVAPPNSDFKRPEDIVGKRIAVATTGAISDLATNSVLKTLSVDYSKITYVPMALPDATAAMQRGDVDGAVLPEPFVTQSQKSIGAITVFDASQGPTAEMPMSGWVAPTKFVEDNPNTVAAFQRGLSKGVDEAQDRAQLEQVLVRNIKIDADTASLVTIATYPKSLEAKRIQRVSDLMYEFGVIGQKFDVASMMSPPVQAGNK